MIYGLYHSAAGMMTNEYRQSVIANNLANADTVGFKRDVPVFAERATAAAAGERSNPTSGLLEALSGGLWLGPTYTDFSEGSLVRTGNPLDVALDGPGFLMVESNGQPLLTRDGRMLMDPFGRLVAAVDGAPMLARGGGPIALNPRGGTPTVSQEGWIVQDGQRVAQLALVDVPDYRALSKVGAGRFAAPLTDPREAPARVHAGALESSSVRAVPELVGMIEAARAYEINARMLTLQDDTLGRLISQVASV